MIALAGKNNIAVHGLNILLERYSSDEIIVVTNKTDTGVDSWQKSLKKKAYELGVSQCTLEELKRVKVDHFISLEFDRIIKREPTWSESIYNIHFSLLPKYKGMYTSIWPILYGDYETGVTLHKIDDGIDTGMICEQLYIPIDSTMRSRDLYNQYILKSCQLLNCNIDLLTSYKLKEYAQGATSSTYYSKNSLDFKKIYIDLNKTAWEIQRQVYAYSFRPYQIPLIYSKRIVDVIILDERSNKRPGCILKENELYTEISTIDYNVRLMHDFFESNLPLFSNCSVDNAKSILLNMCGVNDRNFKGWSPIIVAAYHGNIDVVEFLLESGADINDVNVNGTSLLMYAKEFCINNNSTELFDFLIDQGADVNHKDLNGKKLIDYLSETEISFLKI